eukprot:CAMPEP_0172518280 /NCGR_PEP_ID=MMETSP1066-20121228/290722_1 /TAXON_ID=671091 /ORGANISM="Coscinodiscus wailesii, Strain CCMP2513" /LENGTH=2420 /DNA_ID=CAMNT_0013300633 /DNA_START=56 /DNA_END=7314 /DNA_ORIENTATION=-
MIFCRDFLLTFIAVAILFDCSCTSFAYQADDLTGDAASISALPRNLSEDETYACPDLNEDPVVMPAESGLFFTRRVKKSQSDVLCILVRVTPTSPSVDADNISRRSNTDDFNIVPVARSYSAFDWERVAGPYAQDLQVTGCSLDVCALEIPNLPNLNDGKFILMSFSHSLGSQEEQVSRFYHRTSFGPTKSLIESWNYSASSLDSEMVSWVTKQMDEDQTPMNSHRAYFRRNIDRSAVFQGGSPDGILRWNDHFHPRHPCEKHARWREYSFTVDDYSFPLAVSMYAGQYLLSVNGVPRTLVSAWKNDHGHNLSPGHYTFCWHPEEILNGVLKVRVGTRCVNILGGNPRVTLPGQIYAAWSSKIRVLSLPSRSNFGTIDPILSSSYYDDHLFGESLYLMSTVSNHQCESLVKDGRYYGILGNIAGGGQVYYAGNIQFHENTLDRPMVKGGSALMTGVKPICPIPSKSFLNVRASCYLSSAANACSSTYDKDNSGDAVVICGSPGEVANDPLASNVFAPLGDVRTPTPNQKRNTWTMIALNGNDQLRQRMAWALSQILVITPNQIADIGYSEIYLNYYDIFVRNAFGNYFDILKEVSYSPMMAEMLSFIDSKSTSFVFEDSGSHAFPDENYAREVMQLFSIGIPKLNIDGTLQLDAGSSVPTYDNRDIQNFARAWTGFTHQNMRSNFEALETEWLNRMDPMRIEADWRDPFPKMDLHSGFVGDKKPLCIDLPAKQFLRTGAVYRLLGSSPRPELHYQPSWRNIQALNVMLLDFNSNLKSVLSSLKPEVTLDSNIACTGTECDLDNLRLVQIQQNPPIYYEYIRPECVELSFYTSSKKISTSYNAGSHKSMCANQNLDVAFGACCQSQGPKPFATPLCKFDIERMTYGTARSRCQTETSNGDTCDWYGIDNWSNTCSTFGLKESWHWTNQDCLLKVKVNENGMIAIVHEPNLLLDTFQPYTIDPRVKHDNPNFFRVSWDSSSYPRPSNSCGDNICQEVNDACLCNINIVDHQVFTSLPINMEDILSKLHIGSVNPEMLGSYNLAANTGTMEVWHKGTTGYSQDTIFGVSYRGRKTFLKNMYSRVDISGSDEFKFRNPPHFVNIAVREPRDAVYETDAVLETYFFHDNVAPFLALRIIQRFGISNPSPRYIKTVATAFKDGTYVSNGQTFGNGKYGNLSAMVAAIVLDREASTVSLDRDPTTGSLKEPLIKIIAFMRAMGYQQRDEAGKEIRLDNLQAKIGQEVHSSPGVFSFFLPEYAAPRHIKAASLSSPEAQVLSGPKIVSLMNGIISLVDLGLTQCFGGFGPRNLWHCDRLEPGGYYDTSDVEYTMGKLTFSPSNPNDAVDVVNELSLLLTGGRLNPHSRSIIASAYNTAGNNADGLRLAQKLIFSTPEYHSTAIFDTKSDIRPEVEFPQPSKTPYKAILFLKINGGMDSFNLLVPHSGCSGGKTSYHHYQSVRGGLSYPQSELHQIDASGSNQVCSTFGVHPNLPHLQYLYNTRDLLFISNMGVLQEKVTKDNWRMKTKIPLFAHNLLNEQVEKMDINKAQPGRGVGGRMVDILIKNGYSAGTVSVNGIAEALVSNRASLFVADPSDYQLFNPMRGAQPLWDTIKNLNNYTNLGSGLLSETWSNILLQSLGENALLYDSISTTEVDTTFPEDELGSQLETISKLIKTKDARGTDRDVFYASFGSFDTHGNTKSTFNILNNQMNSGLEAFTTELKTQGMWDDITIIGVSEFGRTLTMNSASGSDHAWGGNYFVMGGNVAGKRILGTYPTTLSDDGPHIITPGIVIPTTPWDAVWNGVAQWFGITNSNDLDVVLPNRNTFSGDLFTQDYLYGEGLPPAPSSPTASPPTVSPPTISNYILLDKGVGSSCPSDTEPIPQEECLAVAKIVGEGLNLPNWLNVFAWENFVPCGCFLWDNGDGSWLVDYNTVTTGCLAEPRAQLICNSPFTPSGPATAVPTLSPTPAPMSSPLATPTGSPLTSPPVSSSNYVLLYKGSGSSCPSDKEPVSEEDCLEAAHIVGEGLDLPDWLNVFAWENFVPCGCFLWYNTDGSMLVDYNTATTGCLAEPRAQLICNSPSAPSGTSTPTIIEVPTMTPTITSATKPPTKVPTLSPTKLATKTPTLSPTKVLSMLPSKLQIEVPTLYPTKLLTTAPTLYPTKVFSISPSKFQTNAPTKELVKEPTASPIMTSSQLPTSSTSLSSYFFLKKGSGALCPSHTQSIHQEECLDAAHLIGGDLNLPNWLNVISWKNLPCGCFLWHNTDGTILVDYNTETVTCGANAYTQMICKSVSSPSDPVTKQPTMSPTVLPTKGPSEASPIATPQNSNYFFMERSFGSTCPSNALSVPKGECLDAAHLIGGDLNLPNWLNVISWKNLPCGCFLWHNTDGTILVDYNTETVTCGANAYTQMICKSVSSPSDPVTKQPTMS